MRDECKLLMIRTVQNDSFVNQSAARTRGEAQDETFLGGAFEFVCGEASCAPHFDLTDFIDESFDVYHINCLQIISVRD